MLAAKILFAKYKALFYVALLIILLVAAAGAGAVVNGWRLDGDHQRALSAKQKDYDDLATLVREQNKAVESMKAQTDTADERRKVAEGYAAAVIKRIGTRAENVANSTATNCDGVLREAWEKWK